MSRETKIIGGVLVAVLAACGCLAVLALCAGGLFLLPAGNAIATDVAVIFTEVAITGVPPTAPPPPTPVPPATRVPPGATLTPFPTPLPGGGDTLRVLEEAVVPPNNLREIAMRLLGIADIPETVSNAPADFQEGDTEAFFVNNTETNETFTVQARLVYRTENVYFFVEEGVDVDRADVRALVDDFQNNTYPTNREFFGSEWNPGVDGDPHVYMLYTRGLGQGSFTITAGYYGSADEYSRLAHEYSNEKEMFYINADYQEVDSPVWPGILAHEFQHMIHWHHDINEETWLNEGASMLAEFLNGYDIGGHDYSFIGDPDLQLNTWTEGGPNDDTIPHYGAAFLFLTYFLDRFGNDATQALVADPANGLRAVDDVLAAGGHTDPITGQPLTARDVFADWVVANYLDDPDIADGRYAHNDYANAPTVSSPTERFDACPVSPYAASVHQYAADYYEIECAGPITLQFTGAQQVRVVPTDPHGGRHAFWSHRNDESDTTLTRAFDLSGLTSATLEYWAWWAIETDYDYAYLEVSADGGATWAIVETPGGTNDDPTGNNFGWGYNANSGGGDQAEWVKERVDLSEYAGQEILVRFEYITDAAVNRAGFMLDDITIPELSYSEDFELGDGGWEGAGFVRIDNLLPQTFVVQVIRQGDTTTVERLPLDAGNQGSVTLDLERNGRVILVVSGTTPFTTELAEYQFEVR